MNTALNNWIGSLDDHKRELFVDTLYEVIKATGAVTFYDLTDDGHKKAVAALKVIKGIDEETKIFVLRTIGSLFYWPQSNCATPSRWVNGCLKAAFPLPRE